MARDRHRNLISTGGKASVTVNGDRPLLERLHTSVQGDPFWESYMSARDSQPTPFTLHLAVFVEPYLQFVLDGRKTVESRFSVNRCAPYRQVQRGDVLVLKRSGGPIVGICRVAHAWFYQLDPDSWDTIRQEFTLALCAQDPQFWQDRARAAFATLMRIDQVRAIAPIPFAKRDRRGWVVVQTPQIQLELQL